MEYIENDTISSSKQSAAHSNVHNAGSLNDREHNLYIMFYVTTLILIVVNYSFYARVKLPTTNLLYISLFFTLLAPFLLNIYSIMYHFHFEETRTAEENLEELQEENRMMRDNKIPIILFGLGVYVTNMSKNIMVLVFPYLLASLLFGTILPGIFENLLFDPNDLTRMIIVEAIDFKLIMISYGFLIMSLYLIYINNNIHK